MKKEESREGLVLKEKKLKKFKGEKKVRRGEKNQRASKKSDPTHNFSQVVNISISSE